MKTPDQNDRNWQALAEPTGRRPRWWGLLSIVAAMGLLIVIAAILYRAWNVHGR